MAKATNFRKTKRKLIPKTKAKLPVRRGFFLVLWIKTLISVVVWPLRPMLRLIFLVVSLWLGTGALSFGATYLAYRESYAAQVRIRNSFENEATKWQRVLVSHPTSREALLGIYATSMALGNEESANRYLDLLRRVDPNDARLKN